MWQLFSGNFMLDGGESVLLSDTLYKKMSVVPRLTRTGTFTVTEPAHTPKPQPGRKSIRKRWSQKENTPIFERNPPNKGLKETTLYMDSPRPSALLKVPQVAVEDNYVHPSIFNNTQKADKSVSFFIHSPRVSVNESKKSTTNSEQKARSNTQKNSKCLVVNLDSTNMEGSMVRKTRSSKRSTVTKPSMMNEKTKKSSTNMEQEARPSFSNTRRSSECLVTTIDSTNSEKSMTQRASSPKRSTVTKTPVMVEKTLEDSVIIIDSTKSERSMFDGTRLTHKSAMKSTKENKQTKQKKSVKLTSPEFTPRNKKLPPLAVRKTPLLKTVFNSDNSILASNRVGKYTCMCPFLEKITFKASKTNVT